MALLVSGLAACGADGSLAVGGETLRLGAAESASSQSARDGELLRQSLLSEIEGLRADLTSLRATELAAGPLPPARGAAFDTATGAFTLAAHYLGPQRGASETNAPVGESAPATTPARLFETGAAASEGANPASAAATPSAAAVQARAARASLIFATAARLAPGPDAALYASVAARCAALQAALGVPSVAAGATPTAPVTPVAPASPLTAAESSAIAAGVAAEPLSGPTTSPATGPATSPGADPLGAAANDLAQTYFMLQFYAEVSAARFAPEQQPPVLAAAAGWGEAGESWALAAAQRGLTPVTRVPDYEFTAAVARPLDLATANSGLSALLEMLAAKQAAVIAGSAPSPEATDAAPPAAGTTSATVLPLAVAPDPQSPETWRATAVAALAQTATAQLAVGGVGSPLPGLETSTAGVACEVCGPPSTAP
ncbi:hypothetical protein JT358_02105 [Micrococcales bacterium 31B]|nr:hypothetical protein [Micrococcales bacterium 31B]